MLLVLSYPEQEGGSDLLHVYASPDWRREVFSENFLSLFRSAQLVERPVFGFFAPPKIAEEPKYETAEAHYSAEKSAQYFGYHLPKHAFEHKVTVCHFEDKSPSEISNDAYMCFVWREILTAGTPAARRAFAKRQSFDQDPSVPLDEPHLAARELRVGIKREQPALPEEDFSTTVHLRTEPLFRSDQSIGDLQNYIEGLSRVALDKKAREQEAEEEEQRRREEEEKEQSFKWFLETVLLSGNSSSVPCPDQGTVEDGAEDDEGGHPDILKPPSKRRRPDTSSRSEETDEQTPSHNSFSTLTDPLASLLLDALAQDTADKVASASAPSGPDPPEDLAIEVRPAATISTETPAAKVRVKQEQQQQRNSVNRSRQAAKMMFM
jgi:hypothetical protein